MNGGVLFGAALAALGCLMFAASRLGSRASAGIRLQFGQKLDKGAFIRRNTRIARIMGMFVILCGAVIAILSVTVGRGA